MTTNKTDNGRETTLIFLENKYIELATMLSQPSGGDPGDEDDLKKLLDSIYNVLYGLMTGGEWEGLKCRAATIKGVA